MPNVRPEILRRYYAAQLGGSADPAQVYADATFDEYFELQRIHFPRMTRRTAAQSSPIERFRALASSLPEEPPPEDWAPLETVHLARKPALDLAAERIDPDVERLIVDRIKSITGFSVLARLPKLRHLLVQLSGAEAEPAPITRAAIDTVEIKECVATCVKAVLGATSARTLSFNNPGVASLDLAILDGHPQLRALRTGAPHLRHVERLAGRPIADLALGVGEVDGAIRWAIEGLAPTLERLMLTAPRGFGPDRLPDLSRFPKLVSVTVSVSTESRDAWLTLAIAHPRIAFTFVRLEPAPGAPVITLAEIYRGIEILRIERGKKASFEISGDLAPDFDAEDNEALEDRVKAAAKQAKKKIEWSSEADDFVARTADVETARWLIDTLHGDAPAPPAKKAARKRA